MKAFLRKYYLITMIVCQCNETKDLMVSNYHKVTKSGVGKSWVKKKWSLFLLRKEDATLTGGSFFKTLLNKDNKGRKEI